MPPVHEGARKPLLQGFHPRRADMQAGQPGPGLLPPIPCPPVFSCFFNRSGYASGLRRLTGATPPAVAPSVALP